MRMNQKFVRKKSNIKIIVFIILSIFFVTIGVGYSYLKQQLNIYAKATIVTNNINYEQGNSRYSWQVDNYVGENQGRIYDVTLNVINYDNDLKTGVISFDVPNSFQIDKSKVNSENATISYDGKRVTIMLNEFIIKGDNINLNLQLKLRDVQELYINNLTLNGLLATNE